jgi:outer membrane receptor protein involved in Fe transport
MGITTDEAGNFAFKANASRIDIEFSFIGFETQKLKSLKANTNVLDIGVVSLSSDSKTLDLVEVRAERSQTEFKLDKRVFNVGQDLSSTGTSALELLNNVPSVNVNIEGEISLRGSSGVQILINGKPSVLADDGSNALGSITADMIEKIEVITNPSAKYEAEGTAGILNIVLKKEERKGMNGSVSLNTGFPYNHSLGLSLNRRTEKWNLFSQMGVGYRELPRFRNNINTNLIDNTTINSEGIEYRNENFYNFILGTDYYINPQNVITLSGSFAYEIEDQPSDTDFEFVNSEGDITRRWTREEVTNAGNPKIQYELQYKTDFKDHEDHDLLFSAIGNYFGKQQSSEFTNTAILGVLQFTDQLTETQFQEGKYTFKLDYSKPYKDVWTFETGAQYLINNVGNDFEVSNFEGGEFVADPSLTNNFIYQQNVLGVYATGAYEEDRWGVKLGARVENTDLYTLLEDTNEENNQNFTNFFPSVHTSFKLNERTSFQGGYSRRIFRPRLWDLNPFFNIRNNFSVRTGNPDLLPEFTDSYEVGAIYIIGELSTNLNVFHRYTTGKIERISTFENNVNTVRPYNLGTSNATGVEVNAKYSPLKKVTLTGDANYNYFSRQGTFETQSFDFQAGIWSTKVTCKVKVIKFLDAEVTGQYESREQTVQGTMSAQLFADAGLRYKMMNGKGVLSFSVRDIFRSRFRENETFQDEFYIYSKSLRGRFLTLGFSYGFGKGDAMEYSGRRR